ncbi:MAG: lipopolysaccharide heptosyltransferase II, partial [Fimbriimonadaceae bacterium]|nr:lipopolysaccharide heptosyltransferase II [Alphaproteobacteria bacterium]
IRYGLINQMHHLDKSVLPLTVQRFAALAQRYAPDEAPEILRPQLTVDPDFARHVADEMNLSMAKPIIALCPGAEYGPAKQWPIEYYGTLARRLADAGNCVWIFGSGKDRDAGDVIRSHTDGSAVHNLCGRTSLTQAIDLMSLCRRVITNDSGLMHVAAALDIPLVALFGSSTPDMTPPLSDKAQILALDLDCRPCFKRECPLGHLDCLRKISVDQVYARL